MVIPAFATLPSVQVPKHSPAKVRRRNLSSSRQQVMKGTELLRRPLPDNSTSGTSPTVAENLTFGAL
jgi:hypothetical protein